MTTTSIAQKNNLIVINLPASSALGLVFTKTNPPILKSIKETSPLPDLALGLQVDALLLPDGTEHNSFNGIQLASLLKETKDITGRKLRYTILTKTIELPSNCPSLGLVFTKTCPPVLKNIKETSPLIRDLQIGIKVQALVLPEKEHIDLTGPELASLLMETKDVTGRQLRFVIPNETASTNLSKEVASNQTLSTTAHSDNDKELITTDTDCGASINHWLDDAMNYCSTAWQVLAVEPPSSNFSHLRAEPAERSYSTHVREQWEQTNQEQLQKSAYLQKHHSTASTRTIVRDDIVIGGTILGTGNFCEIHPLADGKFPDLSTLVIKHVKASSNTADENEFIKAASELWLEAHYLATFSHENIVKLHALVMPSSSSAFKNHSLGIIMDRIDETLKGRLSNVYKTNDESTRYERLLLMQQLASALAYLHDRRLVYRDLKPDNVGLCWRANGSIDVKLIDFGLLAELNEGGEQYLTQRCGTLRYMAPDVCLAKYTELADVYSFAVVLWEVWYRQGEFLEKYNTKDSSGNVQHVKAILDGEREELPLDGGEVGNLIAKGWDSDPQQRPTMSELHRALREEALVHSMDL